MKKNLPAFLSGALVTVMILALSVSALAAAGALNIEVYPISVLVNGKEFQPKDANGNDAMVFTYNGTTYAPLRALAETYGLEVGYDAEKRVATVGRANVAPTPAETTVPSFSSMTYDEFRASLTLRQEFGEKLTEPYNETMTIDGEDIKLGVPMYFFLFLIDNNIDTPSFMAEWEKFKNSDNYEVFINRLLDECGEKAPNNSIHIQIIHNDSKLDVVVRRK